VNERILDSAKRLHSYLRDNHLDKGALRGPTPGVRWNLRVWRFAKGYLSFVPWRDDCVCYQGQGYWIAANWLLHRLTKEDEYGRLALATSDFVLENQRDDGSWPNPIPERKHLVTTIEGIWAGGGLLSTYRRTGDKRCLEGALAWHRFMTESIGYQDHGADGAAINYFNVPRGKVPNNSTAAIWFLSELEEASEGVDVKKQTSRMLSFLADVQTEGGEMPYELPGGSYKRKVEHYQCFQYNAFQLINLYYYWKTTKSPDAQSIAGGIASFLAGGLTESGACRYSCHSRRPHVLYHTDTVAYALSRASRWGLGDYRDLADKGFSWTLDRQRPDGGFPFSFGDYLLLRDNRSYPATMAMTLFHLAAEAGGEP
jgi:hypothetical protein